MKIPKRPHVLYVEDDEDSCQLMTILLEMSEIDVTCALGIENVLLIPDKQRFDAFLIDLRLHDGDGNELCRKLRGEFPNAPVVFYTGCATERDKKQGLLSGAAAYLVKPHSDLVAPTILKLVNRSEPVRGFERSADSLELLRRNALKLVNILPYAGRPLPLLP